MVTFTERNFIERCQDVRDATNVQTPENLVDQLRKSVRGVADLQPGARLDPIEAEKYSRMEAQLLDLVRIVESLKCALM